MLLLHLSDIHFRRGVMGTAMDPDLTLRNEIVLDVEKQSGQLGKVDAVLLSGDIAYGGHSEEYQFALHWLERLCSVCGCSPSNVFMCPGNHDVNRTTVSKSRLISALHLQIKAAEDDLTHDNLLRDLLTAPDSGPLLYEPIANYNLFAQSTFCDISPPDRTIATRDLILNDGSTLRLSGFNSALISSTTDVRGQLAVDPACYQLIREQGVEHLVMCHHPFEWLRGGPRLRDHLNDLARLQLFGHEHTNRIELNRDYVRLAAGAVHPDRAEPEWEPGYNIINLQVVGTGTDRQLEVRVHVRVWQVAPGLFRAKLDRHEDPVFRSTIPLNPWTPPPPQAIESLELNAEPVTANVETGSPNPRGSDPMKTLRDISVSFFKLTLSQKSEIAGRLGLLEEEDVNLPDYERFRRVFLRARERGLVQELGQEISAMAEQ